MGPQIGREVGPAVPAGGVAGAAAEDAQQRVGVVLHRPRAAQLHALIGRPEVREGVERQPRRHADAVRLDDEVAALGVDAVDGGRRLAVAGGGHALAALAKGVEGGGVDLVGVEEPGRGVLGVEAVAEDLQRHERAVVEVAVLAQPAALPVVEPDHAAVGRAAHAKVKPPGDRVKRQRRHRVIALRRQVGDDGADPWAAVVGGPAAQVEGDDQAGIVGVAHARVELAAPPGEAADGAEVAFAAVEPAHDGVAGGVDFLQLAGVGVEALHAHLVAALAAVGDEQLPGVADGQGGGGGQVLEGDGHLQPRRELHATPVDGRALRGRVGLGAVHAPAAREQQDEAGEENLGGLGVGQSHGLRPAG